jgi:hypothetical protein
MSNDLIPYTSSTCVQDAYSPYLGGRTSKHNFMLSKKQVAFPNLFSDINSASFSDVTSQLSKEIANLKSPPSPASLTFEPSPKSLDETLFDATAAVKVLSSRVAMHLDKDRRNRIFKQIDSMHDIGEWDDEDKPIKDSSFESFLKAILLISPQRHPGLGLSNEGNLIASWGSNQDRLVAEFLPKDLVRFVLSRVVEDETERASGQTTVERLYDCLMPYQPDHWFANE